MRVLSLVIACAIWIVAGCGSGESARAKVDPAAAAGDVREVTGTVTGVLAGERRALSVGDVVAAGELIETGGDGDVVIELRHNHVHWHLGPSQARKPLDAAAWTASAPTDRADPGGDRTAAAGRLAEREGADTASTAVPTGGGSGSGSGSGAGSDVDQQRAVEPVEPVEPPEPIEPVEPKRDHVKRKGKKPTAEDPKSDPAPDDLRTPTDGCDEIACTIDPSPTCCMKFRASGRLEKRSGGGDSSDPPEQLDSAAIRAAMTGIKGELVGCGSTHVGTKIRIKLKVLPSGAVDTVTVEGIEDSAVVGCLTSAARRATFPRTQRGGSFSYPIVF
jgi:hypothetical protein